MKKLTMLLAAAAMILAGQLAIAQGMGMAQLSFSNIDSDSNGELSADEIAALPFVQSGQVGADQIMTRWDADSSGTVSEEEFNNRPRPGMGMGMAN